MQTQQLRAPSIGPNPALNQARRRASPTQQQQCCSARAGPVRATSSDSDAAEASTSGRRQLLAAGAACLTFVAGRRAEAATAKQAVEGGVTELVPSSAADSFSLNDRQLLEINRRVQTQNNVPPNFPQFVRNGFDIKIIADGYDVAPNGLIYKDFAVGTGEEPQEGQEVEFHYSAYNENGARIDSTFAKGKPARQRLGIKGLIPGFEEGIKTMKVGGRRRMVVPPELGPPVGPSTFFSAKQCEVFDVQLLQIRSCRRRQVAMFSDVLCE